MTTPLSAWHTAHGAVLVDDRGIVLPASFSDPEAEYRAVREHAGLLDLTFRTQVCVTGTDRVSFLQGMLTNDIKALTPGSGCAAALLTEQGRLVADLRVYALDTSFLLDVDVRAQASMLETLSRFLVADDVELEDLHAQWVTLALQGPLAAQVLQACNIVPPGPQEFQHQEAEVADTTVRIIKASDTGEDGYELLVPSPQAESVWTTLLQRGARWGLLPVGLTALNILRIEAGIPWYGIDMDQERLVLEVGMAHAISFTKGCYLGQEVVERATARGHINRKLSGLRIQGHIPPLSGDKLYHGSHEVGWITSAVVSPRFGHPIALGYVRREYLSPGTQLRIDRHGTPMIAEVVALPFSR
ncbi:MAG: aminomethyltransferase family protein [Candidatus Binatia bacterium]|nr:aminomethyltransferase family protein [Candidatus Binatia bacterium]